MRIGTHPEEVNAAGTTTGCLIFTTPFVNLGVKVGGAISKVKSWDDVVAKVSSCLSKWKLKTLSIFLRLEETFLMEWTGRKEKWLGLVGIRFIKSIYYEDGALNYPSSLSKCSPCLDIIREVNVLRTKGINLLDLIRTKVENRLNTLFWEDPCQTMIED
ncbi:hypothetical protein Tco_0739980 [Tanacetum coccineum]